MRTGYLERYARIQNRYWHRAGYPDEPAGNTYAWMKRDAGAPNRLRQTIRGLVPGEVYTAQLITADYEDIVNGRSEIAEHAVAMTVSDANLISALSYSSVETSGGSSHPQLPFANGPARFNHHRVTFRATGSTAELYIADWKSRADPGGPIGQELMLNYVQVQPYFELDE